MSASSRTSNLKLCQWFAADRPERTDFVTDNQKIEAAITALQNKSWPTEGQLSWLAAPFKKINYVGNGSSTVTHLARGDWAFAIVLCAEKPAVEFGENGEIYQYWGFWSKDISPNPTDLWFGGTMWVNNYLRVYGDKVITTDQTNTAVYPRIPARPKIHYCTAAKGLHYTAILVPNYAS